MDPNSAEERDFNDIEAILPSLLEKDLITDIECRIIVCCDDLSEKQCAVRKVIKSKTAEEAVNLREIFNILLTEPSLDVEDTQNVDCKLHDHDGPFDKPNPLLNNSVLMCLFGFLSLDDIESSRLVCRQWNSTAEIYLRKRSLISFGAANLHPETFMEFSKYSLPDLPFSAYKFSNVGNARWSVDLLDLFFDQWGKNVKEITLENATLMNAEESNLNQYDLTPWIEKAHNLSILKIKCLEKVSFEISMDKLISLKTVFLENCTLLVNNENYTRLTPANVSLTNVHLKRFGKRIHDYSYNDLFDFSVAKNICIAETEEEQDDSIMPVFDMSGVIFNLNQLILSWVEVENWENAKGNVDILEIEKSDAFTEKNQLNIKNLVVLHGDLDLSVLPRTIEKLSLPCLTEIECSEPLPMPNLQHLAFQLHKDNSRKLTLFKNCPNLTRLEIREGYGPDDTPTLHLDCIPKSVTKISIESGRDFEFAKSNFILEVDTLILEDQLSSSNFSLLWETTLEKIRPKVLVISYFKESLQDVSAISKIILTKTHIQKIVVGTLDADNIQFTNTPLSDCVESESGCYIFENKVGRSITRKEYEKFDEMVGERENPIMGFPKFKQM